MGVGRWLVMMGTGMTVAAAPPPRLLVLGTPHLENHHRDIVNSNVEDVLTPARQREMAQVVSALAATKPNHVAVEWRATDQAKLDERYAAYRAGRYVLTADERDQIGLRLAAMLGLARVDAVDWLEENPGTDDDYDFAKWLKAHGRAGELATLTADGQRKADAQDAVNHCHQIADWLRELNTPAYVAWDEALYFRIARFGDAVSNPGAAWVGAWHARNLRIAANLLRVAGRPGDRTVAVFGAGHAELLRRYGEGMGFTVADTLAALPAPTPPRCPPAR